MFSDSAVLCRKPAGCVGCVERKAIESAVQKKSCSVKSSVFLSYLYLASGYAWTDSSSPV